MTGFSNAIDASVAFVWFESSPLRTALLYAHLQGVRSMHIRRSRRLLVIGVPRCAAAFGSVQSPDAPGDPLIAGFKSTYPASAKFNRT
jgi:hypothetical protein